MTALSDELRRVGEALGDAAFREYPLGPQTTYRVGGPAALYVRVADERQLQWMAGIVSGTDIPMLVLGRGSNLLVSDRGFPGLVVSLGSAFETLAIDGTTVHAGGAVSLPVLARRSAAAGLTGLEWAVGVPGSVGGAVRMNAGGHGSDTAATLGSYRWVDLSTGESGESDAGRLAFGYRSARVATTEVIVAATHRLAAGEPSVGATTIRQIVRWRRANQPGGSNAGSVFTNPPGESAGRLIDAAGLKGYRHGTASVSEKHANFIQADDGGSAGDVREVIDHVRATVADRMGVLLSPEVQMVGFADWDREGFAGGPPPHASPGAAGPEGGR